MLTADLFKGLSLIQVKLLYEILADGEGVAVVSISNAPYIKIVSKDGEAAETCRLLYKVLQNIRDPLIAKFAGQDRAETAYDGSLRDMEAFLVSQEFRQMICTQRSKNIHSFIRSDRYVNLISKLSEQVRIKARDIAMGIPIQAMYAKVANIRMGLRNRVKSKYPALLECQQNFEELESAYYQHVLRNYPYELGIANVTNMEKLLGGYMVYFIKAWGSGVNRSYTIKTAISIDGESVSFKEPVTTLKSDEYISCDIASLFEKIYSVDDKMFSYAVNINREKVPGNVRKNQMSVLEWYVKKILNNDLASIESIIKKRYNLTNSESKLTELWQTKGMAIFRQRHSTTELKLNGSDPNTENNRVYMYIGRVDAQVLARFTKNIQMLDSIYNEIRNMNIKNIHTKVADQILTMVHNSKNKGSDTPYFKPHTYVGETKDITPLREKYNIVKLQDKGRTLYDDSCYTSIMDIVECICGMEKLNSALKQYGLSLVDIPALTDSDREFYTTCTTIPQLIQHIQERHILSEHANPLTTTISVSKPAYISTPNIGELLQIYRNYEHTKSGELQNVLPINLWKFTSENLESTKYDKKVVDLINYIKNISLPDTLKVCQDSIGFREDFIKISQLVNSADIVSMQGSIVEFSKQIGALKFCRVEDAFQPDSIADLIVALIGFIQKRAAVQLPRELAEPWIFPQSIFIRLSREIDRALSGNSDLEKVVQLLKTSPLMILNEEEINLELRNLQAQDNTTFALSVILRIILGMVCTISCCQLMILEEKVTLATIQKVTPVYLKLNTIGSCIILAGDYQRGYAQVLSQTCKKVSEFISEMDIIGYAFNVNDPAKANPKFVIEGRLAQQKLKAYYANNRDFFAWQDTITPILNGINSTVEAYLNKELQSDNIDMETLNTGLFKIVQKSLSMYGAAAICDNLNIATPQLCIWYDNYALYYTKEVYYIVSQVFSIFKLDSVKPMLEEIISIELTRVLKKQLGLDKIVNQSPSEAQEVYRRYRTMLKDIVASTEFSIKGLSYNNDTKKAQQLKLYLETLQSDENGFVKYYNDNYNTTRVVDGNVYTTFMHKSGIEVMINKEGGDIHLRHGYKDH